MVQISRKFNRAICSQYETILQKITTIPENTAELVQQQDYVERLESGELHQLKVCMYV